VSRADPDGRRLMWRQGERATWRSRVADRDKVKIGGGNLSCRCWASSEAKPGLQSGCQAARARSLEASREQPQAGEHRTEQGCAARTRAVESAAGWTRTSGRQRSLEMRGRPCGVTDGRGGGATRIHACVTAASHDVEYRAPKEQHAGAARASIQGKSAADRAESPMAGKEGEPRAPQCAMPSRAPRTKHTQHAE
jgi:hypothetical protein